MLRTHGGLEEAYEVSASETQMLPPAQCFSDLLWMPHCQHKVSKVWENANTCVNVRHHHIGIPYHPLCEPALKRLGFYQIAQMAGMSVDRFLIGALVERWRPETHTFHMPIGEMTVTLQDVSCLWELSIRGEPIIGNSDGSWINAIERLLGIIPRNDLMKQKKRKLEGNLDGESKTTCSNYSISLKKLRYHFKEMPNDPTKEEIDRYTRAFILDMLGSLIFPDTSGDGVPAMYIQFLDNLDEPQDYNWGAAALAVLYRQLCLGAERERLDIAGPLVLLQQWCWSRLGVGRPLDGDSNPPNWGEPDTESCPAFGAQWCCRQAYHIPHNAGVAYYRNLLDQIQENDMTWEPYSELMMSMPHRVRSEHAFWFARIPLIHFWIVEFHYPDRVMRQFGLRQMVPPPPPHEESEIRQLHKLNHVGKPRDWKKIHLEYVSQYNKIWQNMINESHPFDQTILPEYRRWFQQNGMHSIFLDARSIGGLRQPIPYPRDDNDWTGYMPSGPPLSRLALRSIKQAAWGIKCALSRGWRKMGKILIMTCYNNISDVNMEEKLKSMLQEAGLPVCVSDIQSEDSASAFSTPESAKPTDVNMDSIDEWLYSTRGFTKYLSIGHSEVATIEESDITRS